MKHFLDTIMLLLTMPMPAKREHLSDMFRSMEDNSDIKPVIDSTIDWILRAQDNSVPKDGGVSRHYCLRTGWGPSYPETSGYIVPTLLECETEFNRPNLGLRAKSILDWLISIQFPEGGFQGGTVLDKPIVPVIFNTGQILLGLAAGAARFGEPYHRAMTLAADWLVESQDPDGAWRKFGSPFADSSRLRAYDTHTAWGLIEAAKVGKNQRWLDAALKHMHHALSFRTENGFVSSCCLMNPRMPYTHTLGYYLRGIIEGARISGDKALEESSISLGHKLALRVDGNGFLSGKISEDWKGAVYWSCLTGSVQIAACFFLLAEMSGIEEFKSKGLLLNRYVRKTVKVKSNPATNDGIYGGVKGAYPVYGYYNRYQYLNWAAKFFIDSHLMELRQSRGVKLL